MDLIRTLFGAFYSAALYRRLREVDTGVGLRYGIFILILIPAIATITLYQTQPGLIAHLGPQMKATKPEAVLLVLAVAISLRVIMIFSLAIYGRLLALWLKPQMDYKAALRMAGVAYTPVAVVDATVLCALGITLNPFLAFGCGALMLLAAIYATK